MTFPFRNKSLLTPSLPPLNQESTLEPEAPILRGNGALSQDLQPPKIHAGSLISLGQQIDPLERRADFFRGPSSSVSLTFPRRTPSLGALPRLNPALVQEADRLAEQAKTEWGVKLSKGNPFHYAMVIFGESKPLEEVRSAYLALEKIFGAARYFPRNSPLETLLSLSAYLYKHFSYGNSETLISALQEKKLDCDMTAYILFAYAYEQGWPFHLVMAPSHIFSRLEFASSSGNIDLNGSFPSNQDYIRDLKISDEAMQSGIYLRNLSFEEVVGMFFALRGDQEGNAKEDEKALADYSEALRLFPASWYIRWNRAELYYKAGDLERGNADFDEVLRLDPKDSVAWATRGRENYRWGNFHDASRSLQKFLSLRTGGVWPAFWDGKFTFSPEILVEGVAEIFAEQGLEEYRQEKYFDAAWSFENSTKLFEVLPREYRDRNREKMLLAFQRYAEADQLAGDEKEAKEARGKAAYYSLKLDHLFGRLSGR